MSDGAPGDGRAFSVMNVEDIEPWEYYEAARSQGNVIWDEGMGGWAVLGFKDCAWVEQNEDKFRNPYQTVPDVVVQIKGGGRNIALLGGEEHKRMRRFVLQLLTPRLIESYRQKHVVPIVSMMIQRVLSRPGKADLTTDYGDQIPSRVIAALLGMPWQDDALIQRILHLHEQMMEVLGALFATEELVQKGLAISKELNEMLLPYIRDRRENPQDDFISRVWQEAPSEYGDDLTEEDATAICRELFLGGADTTVHGIANTLYLILTNAEVRTAVETNRKAALPVAVEEALRLYGSIMYRFRVANQDIEVGGVQIRKDEKLVLLHSAANRDPEKFACPHMADLNRRLPADHLAFNKGPRSCVGMGLARAEINEAVGAILDNLPDLKLDPTAPPPHFGGHFVRSWRPLNVTFAADASHGTDKPAWM
nr:cytochrome P450 [Sphingomonas sp. Y57]